MAITLQDLEAAREYAFRCLIHGTFLLNLARQTTEEDNQFRRRDWQRGLELLEAMQREPQPPSETCEVLRCETIFTHANISEPSAHEWCFQWAVCARQTASWNTAIHRRNLIEASPRYAELNERIKNVLTTGENRLEALAELEQCNLLVLLSQDVAPLLSADQESEDVAQFIAILEAAFRERTMCNVQEVQALVRLEHTHAKRKIEGNKTTGRVPRKLKPTERRHLEALRLKCLAAEPLSRKLDLAYGTTRNVMGPLSEEGYVVVTEDGYKLTPLGSEALQEES